MAGEPLRAGAPDRDALTGLMAAVAERRDREAFARLFRHFAPRIKTYMLRLGAEEGMAEELAQETMLAVWRRAATFDPRRATVATWIYTIARNRRIDALRRARRPEPDPNDPALVPPPPEQADRLLEAARHGAEVRAALTTLPEEQAALMRLAFYDGLSHRDIAARTGLPLGTVKSRLRLAFARMRRAVDAPQ